MALAGDFGDASRWGKIFKEALNEKGPRLLGSDKWFVSEAEVKMPLICRDEGKLGRGFFSVESRLANGHD
jgi:hypothetical protein